MQDRCYTPSLPGRLWDGECSRRGQDGRTARRGLVHLGQVRNHPPCSIPPLIAYRSVDNIRIERLWVDVTLGIGNKWYNFFITLERHEGLRPEDNWHIWLLHFLYLESINSDLAAWADAWNNHPMDIAPANRDISLHTSESPLSMYQFGMIQNGVRGFDLSTPVSAPEIVEPDDLVQYGVDWPALQERGILRSNQRNNPDVPQDAYRGPHRPLPAHMSSVEVLPPTCPFPDHETIQDLYAHLEELVDLDAVDMTARRHWWAVAYAWTVDYVQRTRVP